MIVSLAVGFVLAIAVLVSPFANMLFSPLASIIHELGHTVVAWSFGYPSLPAFDFQYGGGVTIHAEDQSIGGVGLVYFLLLLTVLWYHKNKLTLKFLAVVALIYSIFAWTELHNIAILYMGHGFELLLSGVFLYRAFTGTAVLEKLERPYLRVCGVPAALVCGEVRLGTGNPRVSPHYVRRVGQGVDGSGPDLRRLVQQQSEWCGVDISRYVCDSSNCKRGTGRET